MSPFERAFSLIVSEEGGYSRNDEDPGGETKYGISKRAYPSEDIPALTFERAKQLYLRDYWNAVKADALPWNEALLMFDAAVQHGVARAERLYQSNGGKPAPQFNKDFQAERALIYANQTSFVTFGRGWMRRLFHIYDEALKP